MGNHVSKKYRVEVTVWCDVRADDEDDAKDTVKDDLCGLMGGGTVITGVGEVSDIGLASEVAW